MCRWLDFYYRRAKSKTKTEKPTFDFTRIQIRKSKSPVRAEQKKKDSIYDALLKRNQISISSRESPQAKTRTNTERKPTRETMEHKSERENPPISTRKDILKSDKEASSIINWLENKYLKKERREPRLLHDAGNLSIFSTRHDRSQDRSESHFDDKLKLLESKLKEYDRKKNQFKRLKEENLDPEIEAMLLNELRAMKFEIEILYGEVKEIKEELV